MGKDKRESGHFKRDILFNHFAELVEENYQEITEHFMNDLLKNKDTQSYQQADIDQIYYSSAMLYKDLTKWISREFSKDKIADRYRKLGKERYRMGIPFDQVLKGLVLQRRHLWLFVMDKLYNDATVYSEALELNNRVTLYFDRAMFYMLQGYKEVLCP